MPRPPAELYLFEAASGTWCYTDAKRAIVCAEHRYEPTAVSRGAIEQDLREQTVKIELPQDSEPFPKFRLANSLGNLACEIRKATGILILRGTVERVKFIPDTGMAEASVIMSSRMLAAAIPARTFTPTCGWGLYDSDCGVSETGTSPGGDAFRLAIPLAEVVFSESGLILQHDDLKDFDEYWFTLGFVRIGPDIAHIIAHDPTAGTVQVLAPFPRLIGDTVQFQAGCIKNITTCSDKFNNVANFGGYPDVPFRNPVTAGFR